MKIKSSTKFTIIRTAQELASVGRLVGIAGIGVFLLIQIIEVYSDYSSSIRTGTFELMDLGLGKVILLGAAVIGIVALYFSKGILEKIKEENDYQLDNFEDSVKFSRHKKNTNGQMDEDGNLVLNIYLKRGSEDPMGDLNALIGLTEVKEEVQKIKDVLAYEKKSKTKEGNVCRHYAFLGNPGTGKTTVARIFAGLLYENGRIKANKYIECTGNDLTGDFAGQTKSKVNAIYKRAKGGVLFIDEAYALCKNDNGLSSEAVSQLLVHMESDPYTTIIFAGYLDEMKDFLALNPGLSSRVSKQLMFSDYNSDELIEIFQKFCKDKNLKLSQEAGDLLHKIFDEKRVLVNKEPDQFFSNGRYARNCFDYVYQQHAVNSCNLSTSDPTFSFITYEDVTDIYEELLKVS